MKTKSFWKVNPLQAILAGVLVILVGVLFCIQCQVKNPFESETAMLQEEYSRMQQHNAKLKGINKALFTDAMSRLQENKEIKCFLKDMKGEISHLVNLSECINCCYVALDVVKMGERLKYFEFMIGQFSRDRGKK